MFSSSTQSPSSNFGNKNREEQDVYSSSTVHRHIVAMNGGAIALLQVTDHSTSAANKEVTILFFCVFFLIYAVVGVIEVNLVRNQPRIRHFVGHISHLFGALAALTLMSIVCPIFTLIVAPLWLVWLCFIMYVFLAKLICVEINHSRNANPSTPYSQAP